MAEPFTGWEQIVAHALTLPGTELSTSYGKPAVRVRGKAFLYPGREAGSFAVACPLEEKDVLIETEPDSFWESGHYRGWPAVLVRYGSPSRARIESLVARAWWDRASKAQREGRARP